MNTDRYISGFTGRSNNLGLLKIIAAVLVIYSHAYAVTGTSDDPLYRLTGSQLSFGGLAVAVFFFASGFFITKSLQKRRSGAEFWKGRLIRIYPAFIVVMLLTAFVLGPLLTTLSAGEYFSNSKTYSYLLYLLMIPRYYLPGVLDNAPYPGVINGSLWTLILEMICYAGIFIAYILHLLERNNLRKMNFVLIPAVLIMLIIQPSQIYSFHGYYRPLLIFITGAEFCVFADRIPLDWKYLAIAAISGIICCVLKRFDLFMVFGFPYLLSGLVFSPVQVSDSPGSLGDYSYSLYLVGFPVQQTVEYCLPGSGVWVNTLVSVAVSAIAAVLLYRFVEKPSVRYFTRKK